MDTSETKQHWESIYASTPVEQTGWYEEQPTPSLDLIDECNISKQDRIIDVGSGASTLIDQLAEQGYKNISAVDISEKALQNLRKRLQKKGLSDQVTLINKDITQSSALREHPPVSLWHDRALLHFLQEENARDRYAETVQNLVKSGGFAVIAEFSPEGVDKCSGLEVRKYDSSDLSELLGPNFILQKQFDHLYTTPSGGKRPYIYTLFQKV